MWFWEIDLVRDHLPVNPLRKWGKSVTWRNIHGRCVVLACSKWESPGTRMIPELFHLETVVWHFALINSPGICGKSFCYKADSQRRWYIKQKGTVHYDLFKIEWEHNRCYCQFYSSLVGKSFSGGFGGDNTEDEFLILHACLAGKQENTLAGSGAAWMHLCRCSGGDGLIGPLNIYSHFHL